MDTALRGRNGQRAGSPRQVQTGRDSVVSVRGLRREPPRSTSPAPLGRTAQKYAGAVLARLVALVATLLGAFGCSTIEPGDPPAIADVTYDPDFFYCEIEPKVLMAKSCAVGDPSQGDMGGCHASQTSFRILPLEADAGVACMGDRVVGFVSTTSRSNYTASQAEMTQNPDTTPLLTHPTKKASHPRAIFDDGSPEAALIREWARKSSR
jgi:hypothetical protein